MQKLEKILKGKNIGLARSAIEALEKIVADENTTRRVAQAATQALESIRQVEQKAEEERKAREEAERLAMLKAEEERLAREKAEAERKAKEEAEKLLRAQAEREAAEKAAREKAEREAIELASRKKVEREAAEKAEREAMELAARRKAEREAKEKVVVNENKAIRPSWLIFGAIGEVIAIVLCGFAAIRFLPLIFGGQVPSTPEKVQILAGSLVWVPVLTPLKSPFRKML